MSACPAQSVAHRDSMTSAPFLRSPGISGVSVLGLQRKSTWDTAGGEGPLIRGQKHLLFYMLPWSAQLPGEWPEHPARGTKPRSVTRPRAQSLLGG